MTDIISCEYSTCIKNLFNDQLDPQFFFCICLFQFSTCFENSSAHHQEIQLYHYDIWYISLNVGDCLVCRFGRSVQTCIPDGHLHRVTYTRYRIDTIESPDDEHLNARNMQIIEINIHKKELCVKLVIKQNRTAKSNNPFAQYLHWLCSFV